MVIFDNEEKNNVEVGKENLLTSIRFGNRLVNVEDLSVFGMMYLIKSDNDLNYRICSVSGNIEYTVNDLEECKIITPLNSFNVEVCNVIFSYNNCLLKGMGIKKHDTNKDRKIWLVNNDGYEINTCDMYDMYIMMCDGFHGDINGLFDNVYGTYYRINDEFKVNIGFLEILINVIKNKMKMTQRKDLNRSASMMVKNGLVHNREWWIYNNSVNGEYDI
jgi:hypothetical protein